MQGGARTGTNGLLMNDTQIWYNRQPDERALGEDLEKVIA